MRRIRPWYLGPLLLVGGCADASADDPASELQAFLTDTAALTTVESKRLNAAFASQAVRAWGYRSAGVEPSASEAWSPVVREEAKGQEPGDVSAWLEAADITAQGVFAPCADRACPRVTLSQEQRALLEPRLNDPGVARAVERLSGAALRLLGPDGAIRWTATLQVGMVLHREQGVVDINPRLIELLQEEPAAGSGILPSPNLIAREGREPGSLPGPPLAEPQTAAPPLQSHEPPARQSSGSSGDCDCDCDFVDVRCAIEPAAAPHTPERLLSRQLFGAAAVLALLLRRSARPGRSTRPGRLRAWARRILPILVLGLSTSFADAQSTDSAARLAAGKAHLARKDYPAAVAELEAARSSSGGRDVLEPLAKAYEGAGRLPDAYVTLGELLEDEAQLKPADRERVRRQRDALEPKLAFVYIQAQPSTANVLVDGHPATIDAPTGLVVVSPGPHHISARAVGFVEAGQSAATQAARKTVVKLSLSPSPPAVAPTATVLPPAPVAASQQRPAKQRRAYKFRQGPYVVAQIGFAFLTARPSGFRYDTHLNEETQQQRENPGLTSLFGVTAGMRLTRGVGIGGLLIYGRGGGAGTVQQFELTGSGGTLTHEGPADFTQQSVRLAPHFRFMAGGDVARFLAGTSLGAVYTWVDLEHVDVEQSAGMLFERGTYHHDYSGLNPFWGFDLGAEFNIPSHFLLGFALDVLIERTRGVSGNPFGGTAQGYVGFSARVGFHDWKPE